MKKETFIIEGMACEHCAACVNKALKALDGVVSATASHTDKNVTVEYNPSRVTPQQMQEAVDEAGYEMKI